MALPIAAVDKNLDLLLFISPPLPQALQAFTSGTRDWQTNHYFNCFSLYRKIKFNRNENISPAFVTHCVVLCDQNKALSEYDIYIQNVVNI